MTSQTTPKDRLVRCPRCKQILAEPDVPVYQCGGCGALLKGKAKRGIVTEVSLNSRGAATSKGDFWEMREKSTFFPTVAEVSSRSSTTSGTSSPAIDMLPVANLISDVIVSLQREELYSSVRPNCPRWEFTHDSSLAESSTSRMLIDTMFLPADQNDKYERDRENEFDPVLNSMEIGAAGYTYLAQACAEYSKLYQFQERHIDTIVKLRGEVNNLKALLQEQVDAKDREFAAIREEAKIAQEKMKASFESEFQHANKKAFERTADAYLQPKEFKMRKAKVDRQIEGEYNDCTEFETKVVVERCTHYITGYTDAIGKIRMAFPNLDLSRFELKREHVHPY